MTGSCSFFCTAVLSLLFSLYPNSLQAKIYLPSFGDRTYVSKGSDVTLAWTYDFGGKTIIYTQWLFSNSVNSFETLADIAGSTVTILTSSLPNINVMKPATLVLTNVNLDYNGTYRLEVTPRDATLSSSEVLVIILEQPTAVINCSSSLPIKEGEDITCLCSATGGNPPATASWSKYGTTINGTGYLEKNLILKNVGAEDTGTYKCTVRSHNLTDTKFINIKLKVKYGPIFINFENNVTNNIAQVGDNVKLTFQADGNPKPNYTITFVKNQTIAEVLTSIEGILIINNVNISDNGTYRCVAKNNFGSKKAELFLNVTAKATQSTTTAPTTVPASSTNTTTASSSVTITVPPTITIFSTEKSISRKSCGGIEWYIAVITLFCGIGIGILFCYTVMWLCRRRREKKDRSKASETRGVPETHDDPSVYQELDLERMNKEDNYQSLRKTSRPVGHQEPTAEAAESSYQELDKVRGSNDDNTYQSLNRV